ncbi:alkaline phosphatase family protein [Halomarina ordinaria]|uniref:Alkaline phosphatase family protein n=1 Tax=Halomarina ordinaria TaxID=3033939 RepID=A0ABD5U576_9EURY|nr:nucleotide pyrophosphatase/phosphodiesterase family protein [Halomarina sp. PSRA2]
MFRHDVAADLRSRGADERTVLPAYGDYCFANVPDTVLSLVGGDVRRPLPDDVFSGVETAARHVVVLLVDGFGYRQWRREHADHQFFARMSERGTVTPLTSVYPSETAAAMSTMHTGRQPAEHGLLGWFGYVEAFDAVLRTLPFTTLDGTPAPEAHPGIDASHLLDGETVYERAAPGVDCRLLQPRGIGASAYSARANRGAENAPYDDVEGMARALRRVLKGATDPTYLLAYVPDLDTVAHEAGTRSDAYRATLSDLSAALERELDRLDRETTRETLLVVTADHGHVDTDPDRNVDLDGFALDAHLRRRPDGTPLQALGGPRNVQLHLGDGHHEAAREALSSLDATLLDREAWRARDLFGDRVPTERFERRAPDLLAVPHDLGVWYPGAQLRFVGMHGGLHPDEMLVPFAAGRLDDLYP